MSPPKPLFSGEQLLRALRGPQAQLVGIKPCLEECVVKAMQWIEGVEVTFAGQSTVDINRRIQLNVTVQHSYPEGIDIGPYIRPEVEKHVGHDHVLNLRFKHVEPGSCPS